MAVETRAILRIAGFLVIGLSPAFAALVFAPSRPMAIAAAGFALMAIAFVIQAERFMAQSHRSRLAEAEMHRQVAELDEVVKNQALELRDAKTNDAGTGVLNRTAFLRRLDEAITRDARLQKPLAVLVVDVEGFKALNAQRGRIDGDAILKRVSRALQDATRGTDAVGRLGGDEFGVVLAECDEPGPAVDRIVANLKRDCGQNGADAIHVAVGAVTIEDPARGVDVQELLALADAALASVRGQGGSPFARRTLRSAARTQAVTA